MLVLSRKRGESLILDVSGVQIEVKLIRSIMGRAKIGIDAGPQVKIRRAELEPEAKGESHANL